MYHIWGDVQDSQVWAEATEGEKGGTLPEESGWDGGTWGQTCQGACSDAQTNHSGNQGRKLISFKYWCIDHELMWKKMWFYKF